MLLLIVPAVLGGAVIAQRGGTIAPSAAGASTPGLAVRPAPETAPAVPTALVGADVSLRDGPVDVALELHLPTLGVRARVAGVGVTSSDVMDAPTGPADDPVWHQAFWYRGSAIPGEPSTALIAGHVNGPQGRSAVFGRIGDLRPGDPIVVRDTRSGLEIHLSVDESITYTLEEASDPAVLGRIYGAGPVAGTAPQPAADGLARLNLITCTGTYRNGTHDHRLVVFATRVGSDADHD